MLKYGRSFLFIITAVALTAVSVIFIPSSVSASELNLYDYYVENEVPSSRSRATVSFPCPLENIRGGIMLAFTSGERVYYQDEYNFGNSGMNVPNFAISLNDPQSYDSFYLVFGFYDIDVSDSILINNNGLYLSGLPTVNNTGHIPASPYIISTPVFNTWADLSNFMGSLGVRWSFRDIFNQPEPSPTPSPTPIGEGYDRPELPDTWHPFNDTLELYFLPSQQGYFQIVVTNDDIYSDGLESWVALDSLVSTNYTFELTFNGKGFSYYTYSIDWNQLRADLLSVNTQYSAWTFIVSAQFNPFYSFALNLNSNAVNTKVTGLNSQEPGVHYFAGYGVTNSIETSSYIDEFTSVSDGRIFALALEPTVYAGESGGYIGSFVYDQNSHGFDSTLDSLSPLLSFFYSCIPGITALFGVILAVCVYRTVTEGG